MDLGIKVFRNYELFKLVVRILGKFSINPGFIRKSPPTPPFQRGENIKFLFAKGGSKQNITK